MHHLQFAIQVKCLHITSFFNIFFPSFCFFLFFSKNINNFALLTFNFVIFCMPCFLISTTKFAFGFVFGLFFSSASIFSKNEFFYYRLWSSSFLLLLSSSTLSTLKIFKIIIYESTSSYYYTCIESQKKSKRRSSRLVLHIYNILCYINVSINFNWTFLIGQLLQHFNRVCYYYHHNVQSVCVFCHLCSLIACFHFFFSIVSFRPKSILRLRFFFEKKNFFVDYVGSATARTVSQFSLLTSPHWVHCFIQWQGVCAIRNGFWSKLPWENLTRYTI